MLRRLTERITRDWTLRRQLPQDFGGVPILVTPSAGLRYLARSMNDVDPVLMNLVKEFVRPGSVVWDIGANVGLFTFAAASLAGPGGQVMAMEPDAWLVQLLRRSAKLQPPGKPLRGIRNSTRRSSICISRWSRNMRLSANTSTRLK